MLTKETNIWTLKVFQHGASKRIQVTRFRLKLRKRQGARSSFPQQVILGGNGEMQLKNFSEAFRWS